MTCVMRKNKSVAKYTNFDATKKLTSSQHQNVLSKNKRFFKIALFPLSGSIYEMSNCSLTWSMKTTDNVVYSQFTTNTGEHRILYTSNVMIWAHNAPLQSYIKDTN